MPLPDLSLFAFAAVEPASKAAGFNTVMPHRSESSVYLSILIRFFSSFFVFFAVPDAGKAARGDTFPTEALRPAAGKELSQKGASSRFPEKRAFILRPFPPPAPTGRPSGTRQRAAAACPAAPPDRERPSASPAPKRRCGRRDWSFLSPRERHSSLS